MNATMLKSVNEFVKNFLKENLDDDIQESILEKWEEAQNDLKKSMKKQEKKDEKKKEKKNAKDPNAPKKNKTAYIFFCIDERSKVKEEKPELSAKEIIHELGIRWRELKDNNDDKIRVFEKMAEDDKNRYNEETGNDGSKPKSKKNDGKVKKNKSAYILFCEDMRSVVKEQNPDMSAKDIIRELAIRWKDAKNDEELYESYKEREIQDKERYAREKESESESEKENPVENTVPVEKKNTEKKPVEKKKTEKKPVEKKKTEKKSEKKSVKKNDKKKQPVKVDDDESDNESLIDDISSDEEDDE